MEDSKAVKKFKEGYSCAQSVLFNFAEKIGISGDTALRIATGFGAGMGRTQNVCGAVTGGILVISHLYGRGEGEDKSRQDLAYQKIQELISAFEAETGAIKCLDLVDGCVLLTEEGKKRFYDEGIINKCYSYVDKVVEILERIL